jgi:AcrR family transcriptional regulator
MSGACTGGEPKRRPGPPPRFSRDQLVDAAIEIVDDEGFGSLSLRAVARHLGVTPMALYTYVRSSDELVTLVVDRLVEVKARGLDLPTDWKGALRTFARNLRELMSEHPAMLRAYAEGVVNSPEAIRVADSVLACLVGDGLTPGEATEVYLTVHMLVLGFAVVDQPRSAPPGGVPDLTPYPTLLAHVDEVRRLAHPGTIDRLLDGLIDGVIAGMEARRGASRKGTGRR